MINSYRELTVWQKSIELVTEVYNLSNAFPKSELFGITNQMRRSVVSIPSNIAEGYLRKNRPEYLQFLRIAFGSGAELETQLLISKNLKLSRVDNFKKSENLIDEVMKMLNKLITSLESRP